MLETTEFNRDLVRERVLKLREEITRYDSSESMAIAFLLSRIYELCNIVDKLIEEDK